MTYTHFLAQANEIYLLMVTVKELEKKEEKLSKETKALLAKVKASL